MKRFICIILTLVLFLSLCACNKETSTKGIMTDSTPDQAPVAIEYPVPADLMYEDSENSLGARYIFTLEEFNTLLNDACKNLGQGTDADFFDFSNWKVMSDNLTDENGVMYESYYYATDALTITAAVEKDSKKVMNLSCGAPYEQFEDGGEDFQYNVILTISIIAMVSGGYEQEDLEFLYCMFYDSAQSKQGFYYHNNVYMINYSKGTDDDVSVVLFMTSPCKDEAVSDWNLINYKSYDGSYTNK